MSGNFFDSNVLLYLVDESDAGKRTTAERLVTEGLRTGEAQISFQVVQETLNVITRKVQVPTNPDDARRFLSEVLIPLWRVMPTQALYERALDIQARYRYSFYDSLIIAAALAAGCTRLYSEDLQHGQRIEGLIIEDPFTTSVV